MLATYRLLQKRVAAMAANPTLTTQSFLHKRTHLQRILAPLSSPSLQLQTSPVGQSLGMENQGKFSLPSMALLRSDDGDKPPKGFEKFFKKK
jgi:hypothetical protein